MTHFLEKYYVVDYDGKLQPAKYGFCLIRPCRQDYGKVLDFMHGKLPKTYYIRLEGQVAMYSIDNAYKTNERTPDFKSIEEWLIWLELNKGISPDFEEVHIQSMLHLDDYIAKTIDLHTKEVLYDSMEETFKKVKDRELKRSS